MVSSCIQRDENLKNVSGLFRNDSASRGNWYEYENSFRLTLSEQTMKHRGNVFYGRLEGCLAGLPERSGRGSNGDFRASDLSL